jgi:hypothetical protein
MANHRRLRTPAPLGRRPQHRIVFISVFASPYRQASLVIVLVLLLVIEGSDYDYDYDHEHERQPRY